MSFFFGYRLASEKKQHQRANRISSLPPVYHQTITASDLEILSAPISNIVQKVGSGTWDALDILRSYGKKALQAQDATNCLTEVMISEAEDWARSVNKSGPLAGVPVSLKDTFAVKGYDTCIGYSSLAGKPSTKESAIVKLLRDAGAVPYVKTTVPITLFSYDTQSALFGVTKNPHVHTHSAGGSTGGEAALLAFGGSRIGMGTDLAGSIRVPSHYSGVYSIKASSGRVPRTGGGSSMSGQEGIPSVCSPMARTLEDLETFWRAIVSMKPWEYDNSCHPIPWREQEVQGKKLKWGVMWSDGVVPPSPACTRALVDVVDALREEGHIVVDFSPPSPLEALKIGSQLLLSDGGETVRRPFQLGEPNDPGLADVLRVVDLPRVFRTFFVWYIRYIRRDPLKADLISGLFKKTTTEHYALVARREGYRAQFFKAWKNADIDFLITVPNALPAIPSGGMKYGIGSIGYAFLFNILDYAAGVLPVTKVDETLDKLTPSFKSNLKTLNGVAQTVYRNYDAKAMHGLPVGVQIVARRLEEEKVLEGMKIVNALLKAEGKEYKPMDL